MSTTKPVIQQLSTTEDVCTTVVLAVADATNTSPYQIPPLYDSIDPDALNAIFQQRGDSHSQTGIQVKFTMAGCTVSIDEAAVTVTSDSGNASVHPISQPMQVK